MIHTRTLNSLEYPKVIEFIASLCVSDIGREMTIRLEPHQNAAAAEADFRLFGEYNTWSGGKSGASENFAPAAFPDVRGLIQKMDRLRANSSHQGYGMSLDAFWALREMLRLAQKAASAIIQPAGVEMWPNLLCIAQDAPLPVQLLAALNRCVSDDALLKDESSPELYRLRNELRGIHRNCLRKVRDFAQKYNMLPYLQDEFMTLSSDRYVLPLKANFKGKMQGIIHDWSQTGETCYFEPIFLVEVNNRLQELKHEEREEERKIQEYLGSLLDAELAGVKLALNLLATLDCLNARKIFAERLDCHCPTFTPDDQGIELLNSRHPILALSRQDTSGNATQELRPVRPLDIVLRPGDRILVITGGNAGGKTVCLKTLGLNVALAMSGLPIPAAAGSHLPWFSRMDAFIGDEQSISDNVSTFTAQIDHLAKAWKYLDNRGLILLDEFGAGTDPAEGGALAQAVLDEMLAKKCFVLSATHFPALKSYALSKEGARAASMLFDSRTSRPLFKLAYDQVGSSQALTVAAEHGLPEAVLTRARHYLLQDGADSSALMERLNDLAAAREAELEKLREEESKSRRILAEKKEKLDKERVRLQNEVRARVAELMRAWKENRATAKQTLREMGGLRAELADALAAEKKAVPPEQDKFTPGAQVLHTGLNKRGTITDVDERRKRARLDMGGVSLWADFRDIRTPGESNIQTPEPKGALLKTFAPPSSLNIDVRGMRAAEAVAEVEKFMDQAILAGYSEVEIIHGRGTGALRREIHEFLRSFPAAMNVELAPEDRGGDGMTIVKLV